MNSNFYNQNPYGYGGYYQQPMYQAQPQIQQVQQQVVIPLTYVNGLEGAKAYFMGTNQVAYLRDNNDDSILYEKKTDNVGKYQMKAYKLTELKTENNSTFVMPNTTDSMKVLESKLDAIYSLLAPKVSEVSKDEQQ
jgi:hypothetical protein